MKGKVFLVRDSSGYTVHESDRELTAAELKSLFNLSLEADLGYARGSWSWEGPEDWCECGNPDCYALQRHGEACPLWDAE